MPSTQPLPRTLHLYSSTLFYLLKGNCLNPSMVNKSALDMISWHCGNEQFYSKFVFFYYYLEVHWKILNSICAMLQNCKHLPKPKILYGRYEIIIFNGLLGIVYIFLDRLDGTNYTKTLQLAEQLCFLLVSHVTCVTCNCDHFTSPLALCGFISFLFAFLFMPCV
jgi:hypothetical protein